MTAARTAPAGTAGSGMRAAPVLQLEQVSKVYPGSPPVRALDEVSLTVAAGELVPRPGTLFV